ncbi:ankyrin repeat domain-containing protein 17-like [Oscarella lobularis]|uniref:ankyrin repeat domain-containing protein 17-like n=1 Tax=Oscarella lobularis TaxID=121494 RepID=UPI003313DB86
MSEEGDSSRRTTPLIKAIKDKNLDEVKRLLDEGADPNENAVGDNGAESSSSHSTDFNGPLHWACRFKLIDIAKLLLDNGANVYMEGENGQSPIHLAHSCPEIATLLIENGASPFVEDKNKRTPLLVASAVGVPETMKILLEAGAPFLSADQRGNSPLHYANEDIEKCKLLLEQGANVNETNGRNRTPLFYVKKLDVAKALIDAGAKLDVSDTKGYQPLHYVLKSCKSVERNDIIQLFLAHNAPLDVATKEGETPLFIACSEGGGFLGAIESLLAKGADPNATAKSGETAFLAALCKGYTNIAQLLARRGASVHSQDADGNTAYHHAAKTGSVNLMVILFKKGPHTALNTPNKKGETPLHWAVEKRAVNVVSYLLSIGADPTIKRTDDGKTALQMAEGASVQTIVRVLEMHIKTRKAIPIVVIAREDAPEGDPSQLVFSEGDLIQIIDKPYDEWWKGALVSNPDKTGLFCSLLVHDQPLDPEASRAAIKAANETSFILPGSEYNGAVTEIAEAAKVELGDETLLLLGDVEKTIRDQKPDLADDERRLLAAVKVAFANKSYRWDSDPHAKALDTIIGTVLETVTKQLDGLTEGEANDEKKLILQEHKDQIEEWKELREKKPQFNTFSTRIFLKFIELIVSMKGMQLSSARRSIDNWAKVCACMNLMGRLVATPGSITLNVGAKISDTLQHQMAAVSRAFPTFAMIHEVAAGLSHALVERYESQIEQLQPKGACMLADGVILLLREYLQDDCPPDPEVETIVPSLVRAVVFARRSAAITTQLKKPGLPCTSNTVVGTAHGEWCIDGILRKTGILTQRGRKFVGLVTRADIYGYRHGTPYEADALSMARQGQEKTIGPRRKRIVSASALPVAPPVAIFDALPGTTVKTAAKPIAPQTGSYWLRQQAKLEDRLLRRQQSIAEEKSEK